MSVGGAAVAGAKRKPTAVMKRGPRRNAKWVEAAASVREYLEARKPYLDPLEIGTLEAAIADLESGGR